MSELIQSKSALNQRCSVLKIQYFRAKKISAEQRWIILFWTALIQRKSELISADFFHVLWISAEKRQTYKTALFSADYLWDFNPGSFESNYAYNLPSQKSWTNNTPEIFGILFCYLQQIFI